MTWIIQTKAPHVYAVAERAYSQMEHGVGPLNQSIIVSGESGAGKVSARPQIIQHLFYTGHDHVGILTWCIPTYA